MHVGEHVGIYHLEEIESRYCQHGIVAVAAVDVPVVKRSFRGNRPVISGFCVCEINCLFIRSLFFMHMYQVFGGGASTGVYSPLRQTLMGIYTF